MDITKTEKEVEVKKIVKKTVYNLELDEKELFALRYIADFIGGMPEGPRGVFDSLSRAIDEVNPLIYNVISNQNDRFLHEDVIQGRGDIFLVKNWPCKFTGIDDV